MIILMDTIFTNVSTNTIIELIFLILLLTGLNLFVNYFIKRKLVWIPLIVISSLCVISYIIKLEYLFMSLCVLILLLLFISFMTNLAEFRSFFANKSIQKKNDKIINLAGKKKRIMFKKYLIIVPYMKKLMIVFNIVLKIKLVLLLQLKEMMI